LWVGENTETSTLDSGIRLFAIDLYLDYLF
jgi:hypothetical protein